MSQTIGRLFAVAPEAARRRMLRASIVAALAAAGTLVAAPSADARITTLQITSTESPTFGGYSWPGVGQYEKIIGKAFGEIDPSDPKNAIITDLALAPRNANGNVAYSFDFYILRPLDLSKGAHKMMYEPPNRGGKDWQNFARMPGGQDPGSVTDAATLQNSFLMPRGYSMAWSGWDEAAGTDNSNFKLTIALPVAHNPDGTTITGPGYEYIVSPGASYALTYPAASLDQSTATLTHRVHLDDTPDAVPASAWQYNATGTQISLVAGLSSPTTSTNSRTRRRIPRLTASASPPCATGTRSCAMRRPTTTASPIRSPATCSASTPTRCRSRHA